MENDKLKSVIECLLFITNRPISLMELSSIVDEPQESVRHVIEEIKGEMSARQSAIQVARVAEGYQLSTNEGFSFWVKKLFKDETTFRLSNSAMETLSIIAYKQPISRAEIEEIRGVEVIGVLETLIERKLVKVAGRKETVGRPLIYATTKDFLRRFNLWKISDLPSLEDLAREAERKKATEEVSVPTQSEDSPLKQESEQESEKLS